MTGELTSTDREIFDELIVAASKLATGVDNYGTIVDERFEGMFKDPLRELRAVLRKCPQPGSVWDGELREEDVEKTPFYAPGQRQTVADEPRGVRLRHTITGIERESYTGRSQLENTEVAMKALSKAVRERYESQRT